MAVRRYGPERVSLLMVEDLVSRVHRAMFLLRWCDDTRAVLMRLRTMSVCRVLPLTSLIVSLRQMQTVDQDV